MQWKEFLMAPAEPDAGRRCCAAIAGRPVPVLASPTPEPPHEARLRCRPRVPSSPSVTGALTLDAQKLLPQILPADTVEFGLAPQFGRLQPFAAVGMVPSGSKAAENFNVKVSNCKMCSKPQAEVLRLLTRKHGGFGTLHRDDDQPLVSSAVTSGTTAKATRTHGVELC